MTQPSPAAQESIRQASVVRYGLSGARNWTRVDARLQRLAVLGQRLADELDDGSAEFAITILDDSVAWAVRGDPDQPVSASMRSFSICDRLLVGVRDRRLIEVLDAAADPRLADSPWTNGDASEVRSVLLAPLIGQEGYPLGSVCIFSERPFTPPAAMAASLADLRDAVLRALTDRRHERDITAAER